MLLNPICTQRSNKAAALRTGSQPAAVPAGIGCVSGQHRSDARDRRGTFDQEFLAAAARRSRISGGRRFVSRADSAAVEVFRTGTDQQLSQTVARTHFGSARSEDCDYRLRSSVDSPIGSTRSRSKAEFRRLTVNRNRLTSFRSGQTISTRSALSLLAGRKFTPQDDQDHPGVAIVNESFVKHYFPNENALGQKDETWTTRTNLEKPKADFV